MSSIEHRPGNPYPWRVRFRHDGSNRSRSFATQAQAESWRAILDGTDPDRALELLQERKPGTTVTVADQVDHHIAHLTGVTDGTRRRYRKIADAHIRPHFARVLLVDLTRDAVAAWVNTMAATPNADGDLPAPKSIRNRHGLLSGALSSAVRDGTIPANPARGIKLARRTAETEEMVFLTRDEFDVLLGLIPEKWRALVMLLTLTGIRFGEATALTVGNLDRANHSARIRQAWKDTSSGAMVLGPPKSRRSLRTVAVPEEVFVALEPHLRGKKAGDLILTAPRGGPIRSGSFHNQVWQKAARQLEDLTGKKPRVHDLRHTFASWAIQAGVSLPVIQRQMGHESITTTVDVYGHTARSDFDPLLSMGARIAPREPSPKAIDSAQ